MGTLNEEGVVISLERTPTVTIRRKGPYPARHGREGADVHLGRILAGKSTQSGIGCCGIKRADALIAVYGFLIVAETECVHDGGRKRMCVFYRDDVS